MSIIYSASVKTARMQAVLDSIDAGAGPGEIRIGTTGMGTILASISLADPAGSVAGDTLTLTMPQSDTSADATGTAGEADVRDSDGNIVISGLTVGTAATDVIIDNTSISAGQTVTINTATFTHA